jgi:hypothetical protein
VSENEKIPKEQNPRAIPNAETASTKLFFQAHMCFILHLDAEGAISCSFVSGICFQKNVVKYVL